jgi:hypothetical protein
VTQATSPVERAEHRAQYLTGLLWHVGAFVIINGFFWILDAMGAGGVNWAFWITGFWGFALAFHALAWFIDGRDIEARKAREYEDDYR